MRINPPSRKKKVPASGNGKRSVQVVPGTMPKMSAYDKKRMSKMPTSNKTAVKGTGKKPKK